MKPRLDSYGNVEKLIVLTCDIDGLDHDALSVDEAIALQSDLTLAIAEASEKPRVTIDVDRLDREPMTRDEIVAFSSEVVRQLHPDAVWSDDLDQAIGGVAGRASEKPTPAPE